MKVNDYAYLHVLLAKQKGQKRLSLPLIVFFTGLLLLSSFVLRAQPYGNEWIVHTQKYLKVKVARDGIYRIDSTALANALSNIGVPLSTINPQNLQVFNRGAEQYIYVSGESDGQFNSSDFIEFYGQKNDGTTDTTLYGSLANTPNPYASLFNDTAVYFITWNSVTNNRRLVADNDTAFSAYTPAPYFMTEERFVNQWDYYAGETDLLDVSDPDYIKTEGIFDQAFDFGQSMTRSVSTRNAYTAGPNAYVHMKVVSLSRDYFMVNGNDNTVRIQFLSTQLDTTYTGYQTGRYAFDSVNPATLNSTATDFTVSSINNSSSVASGRTAISYIAVNYPHTFDLESRQGFYGVLPDNTLQTKSLLTITNLSTSNQPVYVYDLLNHKRIDAVTRTNDIAALVPNGGNKSIYIGASSGFINVAALTAVNNTGSFTDFMAMPHDSAFLLVTHKSLMPVAADYKTYRSSIAGGSHNVLLAEVSELYDQFGYGIAQHPLSIRRFADFVYDNSGTAPRNLFLFGKAMGYGYNKLAANVYDANLVPTFGYPAADNLFTAGLNGAQWQCAVPTGRLAARDTVTARWYLDKIIAYESQPAAEWMKHVLHFGGGTDVGQQQLFRNYLDNYKTKIESDTSFGGVVDSYYKTSSAPIQIIQSDTLRQRIEDGVSIMTFFGHASGTGFDQSIDDPGTYNNLNRYPFLLANSCFAGDIHTLSTSSSESFVLLQNKGVIGYLASTGVGLAGLLNEYSYRLYDNIAKLSYGKSVGEQMRQSVISYQQVNTSLHAKVTAYQMTLHGDPALVINSQARPDYVISNSDVWFDQTQVDSVTVFVQLNNIGKAVRDTMKVQVIRRFPNNDTTGYLIQVPAPFYRDTMKLRIPVDQQRGIGLNHLKVTVDYFNEIGELSESNNTTNPEVDLLIQGNTIVPIWPYEFAVIPTDTVTLKASTANPLQPARTYRFEIDTTDLFNSPFKQTTLINAPGGVVQWKPNLVFTDSMVYFWRVSPDSTAPGDPFIWRESSFQYITGQQGWGQAHFFQFKNDNYQFVRYNRPQRRFDFVNDIKIIDTKNGIYGPTVPWNEVWYKINGAMQHIFTCAPPGLSIAVFDPVSGIPDTTYTNSTNPPATGLNGNFICVGSGQVLNAYDYFDNDTTWRGRIRDLLNGLQPGTPVLIYSQWLHNRSQYDPQLIAAIQSIGSLQITNISDTTAFIIFGRKGGAPGSAHETVGSNLLSVITQQDTLTSNWKNGFVESPVIGPASSWGSFHWRQRPFELPDHDSVYVDITGISANGTPTHITYIPESSIDVTNLGTLVDASLYPYLQLKAFMKDDTSRTPVQMKRWQVLYTPVPEAAVDPPLGFSFYNDTIQEGDMVKLTCAVRNVSSLPFTDSLQINYWIIDNANNRHNLPSKVRPPAFQPYTWFVDSSAFSTENYPGWNQLWMEVNPIGNANTQLEQYHFNNIVMQRFYVGSDRINPLLDVTFDGVHILNGDIISAKPQILIRLKDENQFLALNDTADFKVFLKRPSQVVPQLIPWPINEMLFTPAVLPNNSCKILYTPLFNEDGRYELLVQAKDRSNNQSGVIDYRISFEVINKPSITNVFNYPNPFSTSTRFVFTMTGSEVPETFKIQIMTITGKVVREITRDELGPLHIGNNVTDFAWDGRDEFGDLLANGVYLYTVLTRLNGNGIDHRETSADSYFKHAVGKMYIIH